MPDDSKEFQPVVPQFNRWLAVNAAAAYLGVSQNYLRKLIHDGDLKAGRIGNNFRIDRLDLDQLMLRRKSVVPPYRCGTRPWVTRRHRAARSKRVSAR